MNVNRQRCSPFSTLSRLAFIALLLLGAGLQSAYAERKTTYYHTDGLGSVVAASNDAGAVLWRKEYAPFGEQLDSTAENEKLAYTGKQHDDVTGLTYFGARYYDPHLGRFMGVDPVGFVESEPMTFNRYSYANNNPYKYVDPDGEFVNFAAKFVLDVGINVAFNYVTTGQLDVGGALKESAVGILNPAKTVAKAGKLALALSKVEKKVGKLDDLGPGSGFIKNHKGNQSREGRLKDLVDDPKVSSADRGWIRQEMNEVASGKKGHLRNPPGKDLAHERGREAAKGFGYEHAHLQNRKDHRTQHKLDWGGRRNKERL